LHHLLQHVAAGDVVGEHVQLLQLQHLLVQLAFQNDLAAHRATMRSSTVADII
jgi:hypothetical protein